MSPSISEEPLRTNLATFSTECEYEPMQAGRKHGAALITKSMSPRWDVNMMRNSENNNHEEANTMKDVTIIVNGREKQVPKEELTFDEIIKLAFENPPTGEFICFTVTFRKGQGNKPEGTMIEGETVKAKEGMIFNVTVTDKS